MKCAQQIILLKTMHGHNLMHIDARKCFPVPAINCGLWFQVLANSMNPTRWYQHLPMQCIILGRCWSIPPGSLGWEESPHSPMQCSWSKVVGYILYQISYIKQLDVHSPKSLCRIEGDHLCENIPVVELGGGGAELLSPALINWASVLQSPFNSHRFNCTSHSPPPARHFYSKLCSATHADGGGGELRE